MIVVQSVCWDLDHDGFGCHVHEGYEHFSCGTILWEHVDNPCARERDLDVYLRVKEVHSEGVDWFYLCEEYDADVRGVVTAAHGLDAVVVAGLLRSGYERQLFPGMWDGPRCAPVMIPAV